MEEKSYCLNQTDHLLNLSENEETLKIAQKIARFGYFKWDVINNKTVCSDEMLNIFEMNEITTETVRKKIHPEDLRVLDCAMLKIFNREEGNMIEYRIIKKNGDICHISSFSKPYYDKYGKLMLLIGTVQDITERKMYEEKLSEAKKNAEQNERLKTAFLHNISHELHTPLNAIIGFSNLLRQELLSAEKRHAYIDIIQSSGGELLSFIHNIIEISKIETCQVSVVKNETNINSLFDEAIIFLEPQIKKKKGVSLNVQKSLSEDSVSIYTDRDKLYKIIVCLLENSLKYTSYGLIEIGYNLKENNFLEFFVRDTGIGINKESGRDIFTRFARIEETVRKDTRGAGIGLAIAKAYSEMLGGNIWYESEPGSGTCFYFNIPYITTMKSL